MAHSFLQTPTSFIPSQHTSHISTMKKRRERKHRLEKQEKEIKTKLIMTNEEFKSITLDTAVLRITLRILHIHIGSILYLKTEAINPLVNRIIETLIESDIIQPESEQYHRYNIIVHLQNYQQNQLLQVFDFETPNHE